MRSLLKELTTEEKAALNYRWEFWARPDQLEPAGDWWTVWLALAGRGWGKTRCGAEWVRQIKNEVGRIGLIAPTAADARDVMVEGESGIMAISPPWDRPLFEPSKRRLTWDNGAMATLYSADEPDRLRGPQHAALWCFIAGTKVLTAEGERSIETLRPGDWVWTRKGLRPVVANSKRKACVGQVAFDNKRNLVGTAEHPVYTSSGWTRLDQLQIGDAVCAAGAWSGTASGGIATARGEAPTTSAPTSQLNRSAICGCTGLSGSITTGQSRTDTRSITLTTTSPTTELKTLSACRRAHTPACTEKKARSLRSPSPKGRHERCPALTAERPSTESTSIRRRAAPAATASTPMKNGSRAANAGNAESSSRAGLELSAASVASTWRPMGEQYVFCLKVAGEPEYFANGVLVHNCDELAAWKYMQEAWDMAMFGLRLGQRPKVCATTTPRPLPLIRELLKSETTVISRGRTYDNLANLAPAFRAAVLAKYEGTRLGRQELNAEVLDDVPGALWTRQTIESALLRNDLPDMKRIVVAVDPSGASGADGDKADSIGIVVAGKGVDGLGYILADRTCDLSPAGWGRRTVEAYNEFNADRVVAERNYGGAMVEHVIRTVDKKVSYKEVVASRGKAVRAEPVAALYEQGKIRHVGGLNELEDQMCAMTSDGYMGDGSPDRLDAAVWALSDLMLGEHSTYTLANI